MSNNTLPTNSSEWPYPYFLIHRYPSTTEWCDYDGRVLNNKVETGDCIRAVHVTYAYSRLMQMSRATPREDAPAHNPEYDGTYEYPSQKGCIYSADLDNISIKLQNIRKYLMISDKFVYAGYSGEYSDGASYDAARGNVGNSVKSDLLEATREKTQWERPTFAARDCLEASKINMLVRRANSLSCFVNFYGVFPSKATIFAGAEQDKGSYYHSVCSAMCWETSYELAAVGITGGPSFTSESRTVPVGRLSEVFQEYLRNKHGYAVDMSKFAPAGVEEHCEVSLTMVFGIVAESSERSRGNKTKDIYEKYECHDSGGGKCGEGERTEEEYNIPVSINVDYKIATVTISGNTVEIGGRLYAISHDELAGGILPLIPQEMLELQALADTVMKRSEIKATGCCNYDIEYDCCEKDWYCPDGCTEEGCEDYEQGSTEKCQRCTNDDSIRHPTRGISHTERLTVGTGEKSKEVKLEPLFSYIQVRPGFLSLE